MPAPAASHEPQSGEGELKIKTDKSKTLNSFKKVIVFDKRKIKRLIIAEKFLLII